MIQTLKLSIGSLALISMVLLGWYNFYRVSCLVTLLAIVVWIVVSYSYIDKKMNERLCFKDCYFHQSSLISRLLLSPYLVSIFYLSISSILTLSIIYGVVNYPTILWWYLIVHTIIVVLIYKLLIKLFRYTIRDRYRDILAREWTIGISSLLLICVYLYIFLTGYMPSYLNNSLEVTIANASNSISSNCQYIDYILRINIELDSTFWWITSTSSKLTDIPLAKSAIWIGFIIINVLAIVGLNRFIVTIVYIVNKIIKKRI